MNSNKLHIIIIKKLIIDIKARLGIIHFFPLKILYSILFSSSETKSAIDVKENAFVLAHKGNVTFYFDRQYNISSFPYVIHNICQFRDYVTIDFHLWHVH